MCLRSSFCFQKFWNKELSILLEFQLARSSQMKKILNFKFQNMNLDWFSQWSGTCLSKKHQQQRRKQQRRPALRITASQCRRPHWRHLQNMSRANMRKNNKWLNFCFEIWFLNRFSFQFDSEAQITSVADRRISSRLKTDAKCARVDYSRALRLHPPTSRH